MINFFFRLCFSLCLACFLAACEKKTELDLTPVSFAELPAWTEDKTAESIPAFLKSCTLFEKRGASTQFKIKEAGTIADWLAPCAMARQIGLGNNEQARAFFESFFIPYKVDGGDKGLFTGYYEASLKGSFEKTDRFQTPLYEIPEDLIQVDLGLFKEEFQGKKITGKVNGTKLVPYDTRADITTGSLQNRSSVLLWAEDPVATFFLEVQGSGRVSLPNGEEVHVGYAGQNGHAYTSIGRAMLEKELLQRPVTMESIRQWLAENPERRDDILNLNQSYVFFRRIEGGGPLGAMGLQLTPLRSLAVDSSYVPLGVPVWLASEHHKRLVVAQDVGGAIKGRVRGDLFWGFGESAEKGAGQMQEKGAFYLLLPKRNGTNE